MAAPAKDRSRLVAATANQIRLIQIDFADESAKIRNEYIAEEVDRALATIIPEERKAFLEELKEQFPGWDQAAEPAPRPAEGPPKEDKLQDPRFLADHLAQVIPSLPEPEKQAVIEKLRQVAPPAAPATVGNLGQVAQELGITDDGQLDNTLRAFMMLVDFASTLDPIIRNTWHQIAPRTNIGQAGRPGDLKGTLTKYSKRDETVSADQVKKSIKGFQDFVVALTSAIPSAGRRFANRHLAKFSPLQIMAAADAERAGFLVAREVKYWRKYVELCEGLDQDMIEKEIKETIANNVKELLAVRQDRS